ncbi:uncharacterized protein B0I36DRAFT_355148 [Microdochium trichocladiopsis]|uniref:DUF6987 domain-containing protein n=1 Tax=Microdochium trichocladiopsis TaxID=1682393 RepID=A0A9P9BGR9_9PEZI|nr:uncharacterized protein B0I36DRAFT_355148 [Microdochium trichocladiopsis]KAH7016342.1 hypothetical protein B0I36DRAFT_355148 [Microdochium trichocladiopsis]
MSGLVDTAKSATNGATEQVQNIGESAQEQKQQAGSDAGVPRSIPDTSEDQSEYGAGHHGSGDGEGEMVPAAGRINEKGEVVDDDGNPIGKVTSGEAKEFVGFVVTQEGDVLNEDGGVVGKAEPLEDVASELNYTTKSAKDGVQSSRGGGGGGLGSVVGGVTDAAQSVVGGAGDAVSKTGKTATDTVGDAAKGTTDTVGEATGTKDTTGAVRDAAKGTTDAAGETVEGATGTVDDAAKGATDAVEGAADGEKTADPQDLGDKVNDTADGAKETAEDAAGDVQETAEGAAGEVQETAEGGAPIALRDGEVPKLGTEAAENLPEEVPAPQTIGDIEVPSLAPSVANKVVGLFEGPFTVSDGGKVTDKEGKILGKVAEGQDIQDLIGKEIHGIDAEGNLLGENDTVLGKVDIAPEGTVAEQVKKEIPEAAERLEALEKVEEQANQANEIKIPSFAPSVAGKVLEMFESPFNVADDGQVKDAKGKILGKLAEGQEVGDLVGKDIKGIDAQGNLLGDNETVLGKVDIVPEGTIVERIKEDVPEAAERLDALEEAKLPDLSILEGLKINKGGNVVDSNGNPLGKVSSGDLKKLAGRTVGKDGKVWDDSGNVLGEVEVLPEAVKNESSPFEDFPDATVDKNGKVIFDGRQVGVVDGDDFKNLIGKKVDADGDILDKNGNVIGHATRAEAEEPVEPEAEPEEQIDYSVLRDKKVNKAGNVVDDKGTVWGRVVEGILQHLVGKKVGDNGEIYNDAGKVIGKAEPIPENEREDNKEPSPFEDFPGATVANEGKVLFNGEQVGVVVDGDAKKLKGKTVDADGDILDKAGNVLGRAERWEAPEPEPEPEVDNSILAGKRINKAGNAVDKHGDIYGRVIEGALPRLIGKMCDKQGFIRNEGGDVIGKCELIPEAEREGMKEGPFSELPNCTVNKEGEIVTPGGDVVGRLVQGDAKVLFGRAVDDDGDILDKNGNVLGKAERWEKPEEPKDVNPMSGRKVNREGNVVDENGDVIGKLTSGDLSKCAGKKIDDDGDVIDQKGSILGHVTLLEDIPPEEPKEEESEEDKQKRLQLEQDRQIAARIADCLNHSLDRIKPILKMITSRIEAEEAKPEDERDEEGLVKEVRPLIEEGGKILTEANGVIRGLDPDRRIAANAQHKTASREATPEEYRLADVLKELTGHVTETIENAKKKLEGMPRAKKEINPLWGLLAEPLFQIIAGVGLLLSGVLGLVGKLLNGLGLGGLVYNLLGGLGLTKVLSSLGLGDIVDTVTGQDKKGGKKKGGLLGLF